MVNMLQIVKEKVQPKSNVDAMMMLKGPQQVPLSMMYNSCTLFWKEIRLAKEIAKMHLKMKTMNFKWLNRLKHWISLCVIKR
jgi:hypothetical protein